MKSRTLLLFVFSMMQSSLCMTGDCNFSRIANAATGLALAGKIFLEPDSSSSTNKSTSESRVNKIAVGIKMGLVCPWFYTQQMPILERDYPLGYSLGVLIDIPLCSRLALTGGLTFSAEKLKFFIDTSKCDDDGAWYTIITENFIIPVGIHFYPFSSQRLYMNTGLSARALSKTDRKIIDLQCNGERPTIDAAQYFDKRFYMHLNLGTGIQVLSRPVSLCLELQYLFGLTEYKKDSFLHDYKNHAIDIFLLLKR
jgi:hypothetical protein